VHASVTRYRVIDVEGLVKRVEEELVERVKTIDGFVGYYLIDGGDGTVTTITLGEIGEAVEASIVTAQRWVVERAAHLVEEAPDIAVGDVRLRAER
jgi:hypothetical protein